MSLQGYVYIPTLSRLEMLQKTVPRWMEQDLNIRLVVPPAQVDDHRELAADLEWTRNGVQVLKLPDNLSYGLGAARHYIVKHAARRKIKAIIISDDDHRPKRGTNMWDLIAAAMDPDALGVGASRSLTDRFNGGALTRNSGVILCPGGWGFTVFGLNVDNALWCGNFDPALHTFADDAELARNGITRGLIWRMHCDVWIEQMNNRYDPGGMNSLFGEDVEKRRESEKENLTLLYSRWPDYVAPPDRKYRMAWSKMLTDYIPDWKARSALHGGRLL